MKNLMLKLLSSAIQQSIHFQNRILSLIDGTHKKKHLFASLVEKGDIHKTVIFTNSTVHTRHDSNIKIDENSIFHGIVYFYRQASLHVGSRSYIGPNTTFHITTSISIGDDVMISSGCILIDSDMHSLRFSERKNDVLIEIGYDESGKEKDWAVVKSVPIHIQDKVWIGLNAIILKGVTLGEGCVVGAGSVVTKDIPPWTVVAGNPAQVIRSLER